MGLARTILLVEDNRSDAELARRALERAHILNDLTVAEDGREALDYLFGPEAEAPALILLDLNLPQMSGLEVLRRIRSDPRTRRIPVVILTTSKEQEDVAMGYDLGANSYIRKPVDSTQFSEALGRLGVYWLLLNESAPRSG